MVTRHRVEIGLVLVGLWFAGPADGKLVITEMMTQSNHQAPTGGDWWELTNTGPGAVNLVGYSWDDDHRIVGQNVFGDITIAPGESIIILEGDAAAAGQWQLDWNLVGSGVNVYDVSFFGGGFSGLGSADGVYLYDANGGVVTSATYLSRVAGASNAWDREGTYLGFSVNGEEGAYQSSNPSPDVGSPGYAAGGAEEGPFLGALYWADKDTGKIQRVRLDGGIPEDLLTRADGLVEPRGFAIDLDSKKMYWADTLGLEICRANLDGSAREVLVDGLGGPADIALDLNAGKLYWADTWFCKIQRANLDGSGPIEDIIAELPEPYNTEPYYIELDLVGGKIYWSDLQNVFIYRANLDGSGVEYYMTGLSHVRDIVVDAGAGKVYWGDRGSCKVQRANLDGSGLEDLYGPEDGLDRPHGLLLDKKAGKIYWSDTRTYGIHRGDMDGSGPVEDVVTGLDAPWEMALIAIRPDIDRSGVVDLADLTALAAHWRQSGCDIDNNWCDGANLTGDGTVDLNNLAELVGAWLAGADE
jgi:hypothetical protein